MNLVEQWAICLAREVAPDEIDLAPDLVNAYLAGGKERQHLFAKAKEASGSSFGAVDMFTLLPAAMQIITVVWAQAQPILGNSDWARDGITLVKDVLTIGDLAGKRKKVEELPAYPPYPAIKELISTIEKQVQTVPLKKDQRDLLTYRLLKAILENSVGTETFVTEAKKKK
jgi:hypothetical protein